MKAQQANATRAAGVGSAAQHLELLLRDDASEPMLADMKIKRR
jgi:hypothetical protein